MRILVWKASKTGYIKEIQILKQLPIILWDLEYARHTSFYCALLYCTSQKLFFTNWRFVVALHQANLLVPFFQEHVLTYGCITFGNSHNISNFFIMIIFGMVTCDQVIFNIIVIVLEYHKPRPYKTANLINVICVLTAPWAASPPPISLSLGLPVPCDTVLQLGQWITQWWPPSVQMEERVARLSL